MSIIKKLPSITIHVTVKNAEATIKKCIDSLLALDYPNKQIYITEAYSTDSTYDILKQFGNKIRLERLRGNAPSAFNHMINKTSTPFVAFTDADCVVDKNWLKNLIKAFNSDEIIAAGGFCKTPNDVNKLQRLIGIELESRFNEMPRYVTRLPTMNLCVRTKIAKKVKMDETLNVSFEADWGNRITKYGKMVYVPDAVVYHYHRSTLKDFFKQQLNYGKYVIKSPSVYIGKNKFGDYISKPIMGFQLITFNLLLLTLITHLFFSSPFLVLIASLLFIGLLLLFFFDAMSSSRSMYDYYTYPFLFFIRTSAWTLGMIIGIFDILRGK